MRGRHSAEDSEVEDVEEEEVGDEAEVPGEVRLTRFRRLKNIKRTLFFTARQVSSKCL